MARLTYLTRNYKSIHHGGGKARVDVEDVLCSLGAVNLGIGRTFHRNKIIDFLFTFSGLLKFLVSVRNDDVILLQYPVKKYYRFICRVAHIKGARTITLIHDLGSFRRRKLTIEEEIKKLSLTDVIIAANENMIAWLRDHGCRVPMTDQKVWDYLSESSPSLNQSAPRSCIFVGDLRPRFNGYIYRLPSSLDIHVYGPGISPDAPENVISHGFCNGDGIISHGEGRYGLIWYGTDLLHKDKEFIGEYFRYNNPHKLALYIRARKPVIIWEGSGEADFVRKNGIGIIVSSLEDLDRMLGEISEDEYRKMLKNVDRVSREMSEGHYLSSALRRAVSLLP